MMTAEQMWDAYRQIDKKAERYDAWAFCGGGAAGDELAGLVLAGIKTATASTKLAFELDGDPLPVIGTYSVILYDDGSAACVIRDTAVQVVPFDEVSARHAYLEGEDDRSLAAWRAVHRDAFAPDYARAGLPFDERGLCVLEEFAVVYKP